MLCFPREEIWNVKGKRRSTNCLEERSFSILLFAGLSMFCTQNWTQSHKSLFWSPGVSLGCAMQVVPFRRAVLEWIQKHSELWAQLWAVSTSLELHISSEAPVCEWVTANSCVVPTTLSLRMTRSERRVLQAFLSKPANLGPSLLAGGGRGATSKEAPTGITASHNPYLQSPPSSPEQPGWEGGKERAKWMDKEALELRGISSGEEDILSHYLLKGRKMGKQIRFFSSGERLCSRRNAWFGNGGGWEGILMLGSASASVNIQTPLNSGIDFNSGQLSEAPACPSTWQASFLSSGTWGTDWHLQQDPTGPVTAAHLPPKK